MNIGIGIDTGGTCTDAVIYRFRDRKILAAAKTPTTHGELHLGIGAALDGLPRALVDQAELIALSTTLATNACVENKGGRAKLIFFGVMRENVQRVGREYGLNVDDSIIFMGCRTKPSGEIAEEPDWDYFCENIHEWLDDTDAVGVVELYARKSGAVHEKKAAEIITRELGIPVVCGYNLFSESNIVKRGASALLNARLIFVIESFLTAVQKALAERNIKTPFVIVRSDGSLMTGAFTATRPVETLLCGPVASVMGATELTQEQNALVVDIGGTTTDIAFVKDGSPQRVKSGVRIGSWDTFVKGLFVDTFGLGGDSGVVLDPETGGLTLQEGKLMPLCMAAERWPSLLHLLQREDESRSRVLDRQKNIYVALRDISDNAYYTEKEKYIVSLFSEPKNLALIKAQTGELLLESHLSRLLFEGALIRVGLTPTDVMHVKGDFTAYEREASALGVRIMARAAGMSEEETADAVYDAFKRKLYTNIVRVLIEDAFPDIRKEGMGEQLKTIIRDSYEQAKAGKPNEFLRLAFSTPATLVGVGAPTKLFLPEVAELLGAKALSHDYAPVANALGAVVGNVSAGKTMEIRYQQETDSYTVFGLGRRESYETLNEAKTAAKAFAESAAREEAVLRGAEESSLKCKMEERENVVDTQFGSLYMGYKVTVTASGKLRLQ